MPILSSGIVGLAGHAQHVGVQEAVNSQPLIRVRFANAKGGSRGWHDVGSSLNCSIKPRSQPESERKAARQAEREQNAAIRRAEQAQRAGERAAAQRARADAAEQKRLEKEAREAHIAAMEAEVERRNSELSERYAAIDSTACRDP